MAERLGGFLQAALLVFVAAGPACGQEILLAGDAQGQTCSVDAVVDASAMVWILAKNGGPVTGITGAEFRVTGLPSGWSAISTADPAANVTVGDPFMDPGANIAFPSCQAGPLTTLYTVSITPSSSLSDVALTVEARNPPTNMSFNCPLVTQCDSPTFTKVCVAGGTLIINPTGGQVPCDQQPTDTPTATPTTTATATPTNTPVPAGGSCANPADCATGLFCVDAVCCTSACAGPLERCNIPADVGTCTSIAAPAPALSPTGLLVGLGILLVVAAAGLSHRHATRRRKAPGSSL